MEPSFERTPTEREELANSLSHAVGFLLAVFVGLPVLILSAQHRHDPWQLVGGIIFGVSLALLYGASALYHLLPMGSGKRLCRHFDHAAIYVLIAGTYTPFALGALRGPWGWSLLVTVWTIAAVGVAMKFKIGFRFPRLSTVLYLAMGWLVLVVLRPLVAQIGMGGFWWLLAGGLAYSLGIIFYVWEKLHYSHLYWHGFVLAGSVFHFIAVVNYAAGTA